MQTLQPAMNKAAQQLGRLGGKKTSEAKAAAAKANGKKGGRPKKTPKAETPTKPANAERRRPDGEGGLKQ